MSLLGWIKNLFPAPPSIHDDIDSWRRPEDQFPCLTMRAFFRDYDLNDDAIWQTDILTNAALILSNVRSLLSDLNWQGVVHINDGYRSREHNLKVGGKPGSLHMSARAIDLADHNNILAQAILNAPALLNKYGLWMENPRNTPYHVHLDMGKRAERLLHVFNP